MSYGASLLIDFSKLLANCFGRLSKCYLLLLRNVIKVYPFWRSSNKANSTKNFGKVIGMLNSLIEIILTILLTKYIHQLFKRVSKDNTFYQPI